MKIVLYTTLYEHRGAKRLWLEGKRLSACGIRIGDQFRVEYDKRNTRVILHMIDSATAVSPTHTVSSRKRRGICQPIIDINNRVLSRTLGPLAQKLRVIIQRSRIVITLHHHVQKAYQRIRRLAETLLRNEPLRSMSLTHGTGILDHAIHAGLASAGIASRLDVAVEIEGRYLDCSLSRNELWHESAIAIYGGIEDVEFDQLPPCDLLVSGLPCTGASKSGRTAKKLAFAESHDTAGALFDAFLTAVKATNPAIIILENVREYLNTASMEVIRSVLRYRGYDVNEVILNGHAMGALESRSRMCMIAMPDCIELDLREIEPVREVESCIGKVLEAIPLTDPRWRTFDYLDKKEARDIADGKGFRRQFLTPESTSCNVIPRGYAKVRSTTPFLKSEETGKQRLFTVKEHAALKTVPLHLVEGLSETVGHEALGQGVIHCAFEAVARHLGLALGRWVGDLQRNGAVA
jgi:DNA (cytosine-5)-methyltransferase 1